MLDECRLWNWPKDQWPGGTYRREPYRDGESFLPATVDELDDATARVLRCARGLAGDGVVRVVADLPWPPVGVVDDADALDDGALLQCHRWYREHFAGGSQVSRIAPGPDEDPGSLCIRVTRTVDATDLGDVVSLVRVALLGTLPVDCAFADASTRRWCRVLTFALDFYEVTS